MVCPMTTSYNVLRFHFCLASKNILFWPWQRTGMYLVVENQHTRLSWECKIQIKSTWKLTVLCLTNMSWLYAQNTIKRNQFLQHHPWEQLPLFSLNRRASTSSSRCLVSPGVSDVLSSFMVSATRPFMASHRRKMATWPLPPAFAYHNRATPSYVWAWRPQYVRWGWWKQHLASSHLLALAPVRRRQPARPS
jgi:hypothetical protein